MLVVLSLAWPYIAGLGAVAALALCGRPGAGDGFNLRLLAAVWSFGLCLNYALLLVLGRLTHALAAGAVLALCFGLAALWCRRGKLARPERWRPWLIALAVLIIGTFAIVLDPLQDWDARSIWFFHAKMIFYAGELSPAIGLDGIRIPHPGYPKLVSGLAGQIAWVIGFWNEYLPKLSLALLLPVPTIAVLSLRQTPLSMTLAILAFTAIPKEFLYNGSMDGFLALYAACSALFLVDWIEGGGDAAFLAAAGALGLVVSLKVEGQVVFLALGLALGLLVVCRKLSLPRPSRRSLAVAALPFVGYLLWHVLMVRWSLPGEGFTLARAWPRLGDPLALWQIVHVALLHSRLYVPALIVLAILGLARRRGMGLPAVAWLPLIAGLLYLAAACFIFAMTSADLMAQLNTAASRVVHSGTELLSIGGILVLRDLERASGNPSTGRCAESNARGAFRG